LKAEKMMPSSRKLICFQMGLDLVECDERKFWEKLLWEETEMMATFDQNLMRNRTL